LKRPLARRVDPTLRHGAALFVAVAGLALGRPAGGFPMAPPKPEPVRRPPRNHVPTYREMVSDWHTPPDDDPTTTPEGRPALVLEVVNTGERIELLPLRENGGFSAEDLQRASHALRDQRTDRECPADSRLLDLVYQIETHFHAKTVRIISAFRGPGRRHSRHGTGRALDLVIPGTRDGEVAQFARSLGFVGVGLYTRSGFVHVDSRDRSYFWVDSSGPGQRGRTVQVYAKAAAASDAKALERGETPPGQSSEKDDGARTTRVSAAAGADATRRRSGD
jgi:uncharacterized protein YcbK (DUF882 family)